MVAIELKMYLLAYQDPLQIYIDLIPARYRDIFFYIVLFSFTHFCGNIVKYIVSINVIKPILYWYNY